MKPIDFTDAETISHRVRTPLSVLLLQLELMNYCLDDKTKLGELISIASHNAFQLTRLTGNLLDLLRIDAGDVKADLANVDVFSLIKDVCDSADSCAKLKSIKLVCEAPQHGKTMPVDMEKTEKILFNLLSNAIKFTRENGRIAVRIEDRAENGIAFSIEDTGEGISEEKLSYIFDHPARIDSSPVKKAEGTGIGLALVKSYVEILGGRITAARNVGVGSKVTVELPVLKPSSDTKISVYGFNLAQRAKIELSDVI